MIVNRSYGVNNVKGNCFGPMAIDKSRSMSLKNINCRIKRIPNRHLYFNAHTHTHTHTHALKNNDYSYSLSHSIHHCFNVISNVKNKISVAVGLCGLIFNLLSPLSVDAQVLGKFPASENPEIFTAQKTLIQAWNIVNSSFVEKTGEEWQSDLFKYLNNVYHAEDGKEAYKEINAMLNELGDPYTRLIPADDYYDFRVNSTGEFQGVGMVIAKNIENGHLVVIAPIRGSPAEKAGILPGDEVLSIDGHSTEGLKTDSAANYLRGKAGSTVNVKLARMTKTTPPGKTEATTPKLMFKYVDLKREAVELDPVFYSSVHEGDKELGYIKLLTFNSKSPEKIKNAIDKLKEQGAQAFVLDLRNNPGGLVSAGIDISRMWLDGAPTVFNVQSRESLEGHKIELDEGTALTNEPLAVLVNENSASASEILAGALKDNKRAEIIGSKTYGKGKIQTVFELDDGSALLVTVARYQTPNHTNIDNIGIKPDLSCSVKIKDENGGIIDESSSSNEIIKELEKDNCFLTAEKFLNKQIKQI